MTWCSGRPASAGGTWALAARRSSAGATGCRPSLSCGLPRRGSSPRSTSRASRSLPRSVVGGLLGLLVPADPLAHPGPGPPAQALRGGLDGLAQHPELLDGVVLPARGNQPLTVTAGQGGDAVQVQGDGPPPPPVVPDERADPAEPDRSWLVA